jgi:hypothetical protein
MTCRIRENGVDVILELELEDRETGDIERK